MKSDIKKTPLSGYHKGDERAWRLCLFVSLFIPCVVSKRTRGIYGATYSSTGAWHLVRPTAAQRWPLALIVAAVATCH